ncbi:MAG: 16S rRNA (uracil(1498)-N(3))-methyltransferase [Spongiibacteraceae bacterium]|jgi:RsmE family RNA methyltransferase|nr:16S rRNA (uracil(1498)-N(3))-methyltransferase [Spongiibacteraceae bacterium]
MNLLLVEAHQFVDADHVVVTGPALYHLREVLDVRSGNLVRVGQLGGLMGHGRVKKITAAEAMLRVEFDQPPPAKLPLRLLLALPRPKAARRLLRTIAEIGVSELVLLNCWKVEKSYWSSPLLTPDAVRAALLDGLQQARDTVLPTVRCERRFKPFVEDELPGLIAGTTALVAHPGDHAPCPVALNAPATLAIGPEGGFTPYEIGKLTEAGFTPVQLGERILRTESALPALISRLFAL